MDVKCCKCKKEYDLASNIFEYDKANCPILICPHCGFKHVINFMPFEKRIKVKKVEKLDLAEPELVILGASRIASATRVDRLKTDDMDVCDGVAWDVDTYTHHAYIKYISSQTTNPRGITFNPDGTKMYIVGADNDTVFQYTLTTPWDILTASYADKSKYIGDQETDAKGVTFSPDGTKMYIVGYVNDTVYQYTLLTEWDVSTAEYADKSKDVSSQNTEPTGVTFSPDGAKMYIVGSVNETVFQYALTTAWDVLTASYADKSKDVGSQETNPRDVTFSPDGTKMYIVGLDNGRIFQYTLTTPWDVSTAEYADKSKYIGDHEKNLTGVTFSSDGTKIYTVGYDMDRVYQYTLATAWTKTNDFILATRIYTSKGPIARAYKLRWRDVTDEGVFADVSDTGEITYSAVTDLTNDGDLLVEEKLCDAQTDYTWQNGLESEGDNILPDEGTYSLADEYYTEFQWALDCSNAEDEHEYEFELWDVTEGVSIGTCLASITMAITIVVGLSMKWNGMAISKWNGVVINKLNGVD